MEESERALELAAQREELLQNAKAVPSVAEALSVFEAASLRAPYVPPRPPEVRFSTSANR